MTTEPNKIPREFTTKKEAQAILANHPMTPHLRLRNIKGERGFVHPLVPAANALACTEVLEVDPGNKTAATGRTVYAACSSLSWPMFFVSEPLIEALVRTQPPDALSIKDVRFPLPAMTFMFPRNEVLERFLHGYRVGFANVAKFPPGYRALGPKHRDTGAFLMHYSAIATEGLADFSVFATLDETFEQVSALEDYKEFTGELMAEMGVEHYEDDPETDKKVMVKVTGLVWNAIAAMVSRPDLLSGGNLLRHEKKSKNGEVVKSELWEPNVLGANYVAPGVPQGGTHASPRGHWRRGHYRSQAYGEERMKRKVIWIEPCWIGKGSL